MSVLVQFSDTPAAMKFRAVTTFLPLQSQGRADESIGNYGGV